ncbi:GNAT family N-acetyltransferase [Comamonas sp. UBA7528]|uniref:GNAT family N-acetyltransferase n=1 Tax=Comamonas sp. UBA7528 TaxID=1946391 RepID=UPI0025C5BA8C|nr:GNAT family N-acetyltransferase [Comamonas sp. UBA7528]
MFSSSLHNLLTEAVSEQPEILNNQSVEAYLEKIQKYSEIIRIDFNSTLIGVLSFYCNDINNIRSHITFIYIRKDFRGMGFAKSLVRSAIRVSTEKKFKKITIETRDYNKNALQLYQDLGFLISDKKSSTVHLHLDLNKNA